LDTIAENTAGQLNSFNSGKPKDALAEFSGIGWVGVAAGVQARIDVPIIGEVGGKDMPVLVINEERTVDRGGI
jgi:hypothetical protein